jgi:predicted DCC family thiol-disulfide oxidoreductase YuxK
MDQALPQHLVLFDGICAVCNHGMRWLLDHDRDGALHYAPLQGPTAAAVLARHPELPSGLDSIVFVEQTPDGERVSVHSGALLGIARLLPSPWRLFTGLRWVPRFVRDPLYRLFAAVRYRVFGTVDLCRIPRPDEMERFLD